MSEEKPLETTATNDEIPAQQFPTIDENAEKVKPGVEPIDTINKQPSPTPPTVRQNLTHISHQIHSPQSWNFFSGEDVKTEFQVHNLGVDQPTETPFTPSKDTYRRQKEVRRDSIGKRNEKTTYASTTVIAEERTTAIPSAFEALELREAILERRERELERREREIDRRERDLERRERELERRQREFDFDKGRSGADSRNQNIPQQHLQEMIEVVKKQLQSEISTERKKTAEREAAFEEKVMKRVNDVLENERQLYGVMKMSDHEVNEMMERNVGYLMQNDEDIADRVRFQSLVYLTQEKLASEAGLQPPQGSDSFSLSWRLALGPSLVTEERYNKALELLKGNDLQETTKRVVECKRAMEYAVEYTFHLRKEGTDMGDHSFSLGRISRKDYMESVERHSQGDTAEYEALKTLVDFICP